MAGIKILLAEPSFIIRKGISGIISELPEFRISCEVVDKNSLTSSIEDCEPDLIILNPALFVNNDCKVPLSFIPPRYRKNIIGLLYQEDNCNFFQFFEKLYINESKSNIIGKLKNCISRTSSNKKENLESGISEREKLVVKYIALGLTNKEIADRLFISSHTVITHRKNITRKLGIKTVSGLTIYAIMNNLIALEEIK